jgi:serine/threonine protein kinase
VLLASNAAAPHGFCIKISDFGMSRKMDIQSRIATKTTGTVTYMPPEVLAEGIVSKVGNNPHPDVEAADVYGPRPALPCPVSCFGLFCS